MKDRVPLPIDSVLREIVSALRVSSSVVVKAPPGAGKTTRVPQALLDEGLIPQGSRLLMLEPRRLAARMAAVRIATERGTPLGGEVGYQIRFDDRTSEDTRIAVLTEGILTRRLQHDAVLEGVSAVVIDEFHERSVHADLAIAFAREVQETVRPDLRIVVMSATLAPLAIAEFLRGCPIVESTGRAHPVAVSYLDQRDERPLEKRVISAIRGALRNGDTERDMLVFLPGAPEIRRVAEALGPIVGAQVDVCPLYGELDDREQERALRPSPRRKIVLATNIAESSITIEGVTTVIDSGFEKILRNNPASGVDRLELVRISRASAEQRAGRAGRLAPGRALRLWTRAEDHSLPPEQESAITRTDLAPTVLEVIRWTGKSPETFAWFESPPKATIERAVQLLRLLGLIDRQTYALTPLGRCAADLPLHPRIAVMLIAAAEYDRLRDGAILAALITERDILARRPRDGSEARAALADTVASSDLIVRLDRLEELERASFSSSCAGRLGLDAGAARNVAYVKNRILEIGKRTLSRRSPERKATSVSVPKNAASVPKNREEAILRVTLAGFPDRVGRRQAATSGRLAEDRYALVGGGGARRSPTSAVKEASFLVAVEVEGRGFGQRDGGWIRIASQIDPEWLFAIGGGLHEIHGARWNREREAVETIRELRYHDLLIREGHSAEPSGARDPGVSRALEEAASESIDRALPITDEVDRAFRRIAFLRRAMPELELPEIGPETRVKLLPILCDGKRSFAELRAINLAEMLTHELTQDQLRALEAHAPERMAIPSGNRILLRYETDGPPVLSVRLQEIFGLIETPRIARGRVALRMELLGPNMRPVQVTQDLSSFWRTTYGEVRKELRRRYPKHQWPEDPRDGIPSARAKPFKKRP